MKTFNKILFPLLSVAFSISAIVPTSASMPTVGLGTSTNFAVLAGSTITNTGSSVINGDLGLAPGSSITGFPPGIINGSQHVNDAVAIQAQTDLTTAYNDAAGRTPVTTVPTELGATTKTAGVYDAASGTFQITGTLTLDAQGDPNAVFVFKTASTLITAGASNINLINNAQSCNVFWQVGTSATIGTTSTFKGNLMALTSVTLTNGASVEGRILTRNAAVTLDTNIINKATCSQAVIPTSTPNITTTPKLPNTSIVPKLPNAGAPID